MGAYLAESFEIIAEAGFGMGCKDHISGAINDTIIWIFDNVIKELYDGCGSVFIGCSLLVSNGT